MAEPKHLRRPSGEAGEAGAGAQEAPKGADAAAAAPAAGGSGPDQAGPARPETGDAPQDGSAGSVARSAAMMSVLVIISRITGLMRTWGQSIALGVTGLASVYTVANNMPNMLYELVAGGVIMTAFLPTYIQVRKRLGREGSNRYASNLIAIVGLFMLVLTAVSLVFADFVIWTNSAGAAEGFDHDLSVYFFRFFAIEVVLYALSSILSGILNAERDYFWSNAAPIFNNVICTLSFVLYLVFAKSNPTVAILSLALGNPLGVLVQVLLQVPSLKRHGIRLRLLVDFHDPALKDMLSIGLPTLVVTVASFPTVSVMSSAASQVTAAGPSIAYYSRIWYMLPYSVFAVPITVALFTELSQYASDGDMDSFKRGLLFGVNRINFWLVPFMMYLMVFAPELSYLLAAGRIDSQALAEMSVYLVFLATALPAYGVSTLLQKVCSSLHRMMAYAVAAVVGAAVQVAFCLWAVGPFGLAGVAFSSTLYYAAIDVVALFSLRRTLGHVGVSRMAASALRSLVVGLAGAAVGALVLAGVTSVLGEVHSLLGSVLYCVAGGVPAVAVTYGLALATKMPESQEVKALLRRSRS